MDESQPPQTTNRNDKRGGGSRTGVRLGALLAVALLAGIAAWVVIDRSNNKSAATTSSTSASTTPTTTASVAGKIPLGPIAVTAAALAQLAAAASQPVYWAGPTAGDAYEFTRTTNGDVYVRYLPKGVKAGAPGAKYLIVVTYPFPNAFNALKVVAKGAEVRIPGGGIALVDTAYPKSVHFAFPNVAYEGEVFDPSPAKSLRVATSTALHPVP